jgi:hypothetical protein
MSTEIEHRRHQVRDMAESVAEALRQEVIKMGFPITCIDPDINRAEYTLSRDPASGEHALIGIWRDQRGYKQGEILFHADGSFFAEYDVISTHPKKTKWFVESVTAWGRDNLVKAEPKLLPVVE